MGGETLTTDWRSTRKIKTFRRIQEEAISLFLAKGYEQTTIEEIAAAAGVSHMTVFRHFPTKEALVLTDEFDTFIFEAIRQRPSAEGPVAALLNTIRELLSQVEARDSDLMLARFRLIAANPSLSGAQWASMMAIQAQITEALLERSADERDDFQIRVVLASILAAGMTASQYWAEHGGVMSLETVMTRSLDVLREESDSFIFAADAAPAPPE